MITPMLSCDTCFVFRSFATAFVNVRQNAGKVRLYTQKNKQFFKMDQTNNTEESELNFDHKDMNTMLEYENQIFLEILHKDGLVVTAKGITIDVILTNLLKVYCDPGNLVIVMNYGDDEKYYTKKLCSDIVFSASLNVNEREINYLMGGIHFVTTRILVIDLLKKRIPIDKITGIFVLRAHTVLESCQEAFALRLYRQNNKSGFIKAFSNCAESFTYGFGHVERIMRSLLVKELFIWPRFHSLIRQSLKANEPAIVELHVPISKTVASIQTAVLELMNDTVKELKRINKTLELQEITVENCVAKKYHKILQAQLDCIWHQLSARSRQLIADLKTLRVVLYDDPITFHSVVSQYRTAEYAQTCTWVLQDGAEQLFGLARRLVFSADGRLDPEAPGKWAVLSDILTVEIPAEAQPDDGEPPGILLLCQDNKTCFQLSQYLKHGADKYLFLMALKHGVKHAGLSARLERLLGSDVTLAEFGCDTKRPRKDNKADDKADDKADSRTLFEEDYENCRTCYVLTMSQVSSEATRNDPRPDYTFDEFPEMEQMELSTAGRCEPLLVIQTFSAPALQTTLEELRPRYILMYHSSVTAVRQIETYASRALTHPPRVYFLVHAGTVEEQSYLTTLRRERQAFEHLISTKAAMVMPDELDCGAPAVNEPIPRSSRYGGRAPPTDPHTIIVDMREFRSDLPALIHRRGIRVEPMTIAVGDYVLTADVCVERKSLSDLIGSLNSGRLYQQCTHMSRHYAKPMLLIEFDQNQPFKFQFRGRYMASSEPAGEADTQKKLQLLTMHFPRLKIVWSPSPYASAQLFEELKEGQAQPSLEYANAINTESDIESIERKYNTNVYDFVQKLPGINTKNIHGFLRNCKNLVEALTKSQDELKEILGNSSDAKLFYDILHEKPSQPDAASKKAPFRKKFTRNKFL